MPELPERIRKHYANTSLSAEALQRILAKANGERRARVLAWAAWGVAACVLILFFIGRQVDRPGLAVAEVENQVREFFSRPDSQLDFVSPDPATAQQWLAAHGGPSAIQIPHGLSGKRTAGCEILGTGKDRAFVMCFIDEPSMENGLTGTPRRTKVAIFHLVVVAKSAVKNLNLTSSQRRFVVDGEWSFAEWHDGPLIYILATDAGVDRLKRVLQV